MDINVTSESKILIIEGIAGSGKNTLHQQLMGLLADKIVYDFHEEELLCSWKHGWIPGIDSLRLNFMDSLLDYCTSVTEQNDKAVFIVNRFHVTFHLFALTDASVNLQYLRILEKLKKLRVHIYVPIVQDEQIEARSSHKERQDPIWQLHLKKRLAQRGFSTLTEMYSEEQKKIKAILEKQGLPYTLVTVEVPHGKVS